MSLFPISSAMRCSCCGQVIAAQEQPQAWTDAGYIHARCQGGLPKPGGNPFVACAMNSTQLMGTDTNIVLASPLVFDPAPNVISMNGPTC